MELTNIYDLLTPSDQAVATPTLTTLLIILGSALGLGFIIGLVYIFTNRKSDYSKGLAITLVVLPIVISVIIYLVQDNVVRAFSLAGTFSIIRFRSTQGNPRDLALIFTTLAVGLACGTGYLLVGLVLVVFVAAVLILIDLLRFGDTKKERMILKVTIPESLNYVGVFDEVFEKYTVSNRLTKVKSSNFGTMFILSFDVVLKKDVNQKEFIDDLRCKNGNLDILLQNYVYSPGIVL